MNKQQKVLVIGGGIAGIQASLDLANRGIKVYLVEKSPSIGGRMAQLDKTFPTLDCSICILAPKMIEVSRHRNIELLVYSEVESVEGYVGNFKVKVKRKPRYIDGEKCTGCGGCAEACLLKGRIPNEFDLGLSKRGAAYVPFPQAVPLKYTIDPEHCIYLTRRICGKKKDQEGRSACEEACLRGAINFEQHEKLIELNVGAIIVATGFDLFDVQGISEYGYGRYKDVLTSLEFERLLCATGPTGGHLVRISDHRVPRKIVFVQCVGSRSERGESPYCSSVCCAYATKEGILVKEHEPECDIEILYMDMRAIGKGLQEFMDRAEQEWGVKYTKGRPSRIEQDPTGGFIVHYEDVVSGEPREVAADIVVLCPALVPSKGSKELAKVLGIELDEYGFLKSKDALLAPIESNVPGIFICGYAQGPKDIPESVAQASGAVAKAAELMAMVGGAG